MISSRADIKNNILYINIIGHITKDKLSNSMREISEKCTQMREGYCLINDMSLLKISSIKDLNIVSPFSKKISKIKTIGKVIRILPNIENLQKHLEKSDKTLELQNIHYVKNKKEALDLRLKI